MKQLNKFTFLSHITFSIGWLGAVVVFLILAITGLSNQSSFISNSAYVAMNVSAWYVIVPLSMASFITGVVQAVTTRWGLFKYYWIVVKLFLTLVITVLLLLHLNPISYMAGIAADTTLAYAKEHKLRIQLIADAVAAIVALLFIATISVYKPWGKIRSSAGRTANIEQEIQTRRKKSFGFYVLVSLAIFILIVIIKHIFGGGMANH